MDEDIKLYSDMERYEIININDGEKYDYLGNNDIIVDEEGNLKLLILSEPNVKLSFFSKSDFIEVPWEYVKKIGSRTIIIDVDERSLKKTRI
ncbi:YlmC/YmxH family sporulation protein [Clostridium sp. MSJ-11]|uniref:YlmC/YmxH family sporulation protein n=1 Tax=Clostridium mobile TaxID=2841512 RepID=A0ABS6EC67_9CLOT|nr:YlmC/YmxH family sporulation protein [Clostridium mobile]MBU5482794.1 YlmC/YmxH family sporulation protein [Clostridium mobile]